MDRWFGSVIYLVVSPNIRTALSAPNPRVRAGTLTPLTQRANHIIIITIVELSGVNICLVCIRIYTFE